MANTTIVTSQSPDAKPIAKNLELTTNWQTIIEVPQYEIPELVFGGTTTIASGVGEVISPLIVCNKTANTATLDLQIYRYDTSLTFYLTRNLPVPPYDTIPIPLNGQFFKTGDLLEARSDTNLALDITLSFTLGQAEEDDVQ